MQMWPNCHGVPYRELPVVVVSGTKVSTVFCHAGRSNEVSREPEEEGMWLALSQIQEWVVEYGCDMLFITFRTDVAWYRLSK